jgi:hypothetical protein
VLVTRSQLVSLLHPKCSWTPTTLADDLAPYFAGAPSLELSALLDQWLEAPKGLKEQHGRAYLVRQLTGERWGARSPLEYLKAIRASI